jgi:hypothetical protein
MAINYPKFDQKINDQISNNKFQQTKTRPGTIMAYNKSTNTATVLLEERYAGTIGDIIANVPCPFTYGIQAVAPHPGVRCIVGFREDAERNPYIVTFYNDAYDTPKNIINTHVDTGTPKFMV